MAVIAPILCLEVFACDVMNKAGMCGGRVDYVINQPFSAFHRVRANQHGCVPSSSNSKPESTFVAWIFSPHVTSSGWLGSEHQLTNLHTHHTKPEKKRKKKDLHIFHVFRRVCVFTWGSLKQCSAQYSLSVHSGQLVSLLAVPVRSVFARHCHCRQNCWLGIGSNPET